MGYWQRWYRPLEIERETYSHIVRDFKKLLKPLARVGVRLGDAWGQGKPVVTEDRVVFNGLARCRCKPGAEFLLEGVDAVDLGDLDWAVRSCHGSCCYETFDFPRVEPHPEYADEDGRMYHTMKTNRRPYDLAVTSFLLIAKRYLGGSLAVLSDSREAWWDEPRALCQQVLGYGEGMFVAEPWTLTWDSTDPRSRALLGVLARGSD